MVTWEAEDELQDNEVYFNLIRINRFAKRLKMMSEVRTG